MDFSDLSAATLNVNGMNNYNKRQSVRLWFRNQGLDVLCLQEVHVDSMQRASVWGAESPDIHCIWSPSTSHSAGVAVWMRAYLPPYIDNVSADDEGRLVAVRLVRERRLLPSLDFMLLSTLLVVWLSFLVIFQYWHLLAALCLAISTLSCRPR